MNADDAQPGVHVTPSTARQLPAAGGHLLASTSETSGQFSLIDTTVPPHDSTPVHRHHLMDESVVVLEGSFTFTCGDREFEASAGDFVHLPREIRHRYVAGPKGGRMLIIGTPGGLERFFDDWESGMSLEAAAREHSIEFLDE